MNNTELVAGTIIALIILVAAPIGALAYNYYNSPTTYQQKFTAKLHNPKDMIRWDCSSCTLITTTRKCTNYLFGICINYETSKHRHVYHNVKAGSKSYFNKYSSVTGLHKVISNIRPTYIVSVGKDKPVVQGPGTFRQYLIDRLNTFTQKLSVYSPDQFTLKGLTSCNGKKVELYSKSLSLKEGGTTKVSWTATGLPKGGRCTTKTSLSGGNVSGNSITKVSAIPSK